MLNTHELWAHDMLHTNTINYSSSSCSSSWLPARPAGPDPSCQEQLLLTQIMNRAMKWYLCTCSPYLAGFWYILCNTVKRNIILSHFVKSAREFVLMNTLFKEIKEIGKEMRNDCMSSLYAGAIAFRLPDVLRLAEPQVSNRSHHRDGNKRLLPRASGPRGNLAGGKKVVSYRHQPDHLIAWR